MQESSEYTLSNNTIEGDPFSLQLFFLYREIEKAVLNQIHLKSFPDITMSDIQTLYLIKKSGSNAKNLTQKTGTSKQAVSKNINSLVKRKYLMLGKDKEDARAKQILITKKGEKLFLESSEFLKMIELKYENQIGKFIFVQLKINLRKLLSVQLFKND